MTVWKAIEDAVSALSEIFGTAPKVAIVLGSGLGRVTERMGVKSGIPSDQIPGWPKSTVKGHAGYIHIGKVTKKRVLVIEGRVHMYEGYSAEQVVLPVRAAAAWGVRTIMLTNAAGSLDPKLLPGSLMLIKDHINLSGRNPLIGPAGAMPGPRFLNLSDLYSDKWRGRAVCSAEQLGIPLEEGVYAGLLGPSYETPAEVKMLAGLGARAVGMSTVMEAIAGRHLGAEIVGISSITNMAAGLKGAVLDHNHVQKIGMETSERLGMLIEALIAEKKGKKQ